MAHPPSPERFAGSGEESVPPNESEMARFKAFAKRLLNVPQTELAEKEAGQKSTKNMRSGLSDV